MVESTARRDRIDSQAVTGWYLWEAPKKPACVYLSLDLIDKLEREVVENFRSLTSRGSEVGGILLGGVAPGVPASISIESYEAIPCDYSRGPLYRLSDADLGRFERAMEQRSSGNLQAVGFFRSHTRKGLALDAEDLAFLEAKFRNPYALALLVRPFATKASVAGIFLREEAGFNSDASALEFPFRSSQLTPSKRGPEPAAPSSGPTRGQVVPIATRREVTAPPAPAAPIAPPPPVIEPPKPAVVPESKAATPAPPAPPAAPEKPRPASAPEAAAPAPTTPKNPPTAAKTAAPQPKTAPAPEKSAAPAAAPAVAVSAPAKAKESAPAKTKEPAPAPKLDEPKTQAKRAQASEPAETKPASKVPMLTGLLAAGLLLFVALFVYPGFLHHSSKPSTASVQDSSPLTLRVEHTGTDLLLTWNRDSAAIRNASHATLSISDGDRHENYEMDLAQLRTGSIVYSPLGGDVSFQMEVVGKDQSRTATETLRLLQTRPSPMPVTGQDTKGTKNNTTQTPVTAPANAEVKATEPTPQPEETKQAPAPVKQFDASSLSGRLRPARAADIAEVPSPAAASAIAPKVSADGSLPFASLPGAPAAPPPPAPAPPARTSTPAAATPSPAAPSASAKLDPSGGQIQPAQLISRKEPEYPLLARQMGAKGTVELIATIGPDGTVKAVKIVKGHPLLIKAAQDAVMQWRYRPTLLNGVPVQNDTRITLNFVAPQ